MSTTSDVDDAESQSGNIGNSGFKGKMLYFSRRFRLKDLFTEVGIIKRLAYKNTNQHRSSPSFRKVLHAIRATAKLNNLCISECITENLCVKEHPFIDVEDFEHSELYRTLLKLHDFERILRIISSSSEDAHKGFLGYIEKTFFMAVSMVIVASTARIGYLTKKALNEVERCKISIANEILSSQSSTFRKIETANELNSLKITLQDLDLCEVLHFESITEDANNSKLIKTSSKEIKDPLPLLESKVTKFLDNSSSVLSTTYSDDSQDTEDSEEEISNLSSSTNTDDIKSNKVIIANSSLSDSFW